VRSEKRWRRVFPFVEASIYRNQPDRCISVEEMVNRYRDIEVPVKRVRLKCAVNRKSNIWGRDDDTGDMILLGEEIHSHPAGLHFMNPQEASKLAEFYFRQDVPF
jgi:hypothetical protein